MANLRNDDLFPEVRNPHGTCVINERCLVRTQDGYRVVSVSGVVLAQYAVTDRMAEAHAMVSLVDQGWADQNDVARSFGCSVRTVRRHQRRFEDGGLAALGRTRGYPLARIFHNSFEFLGRARILGAKSDRGEAFWGHGCRAGREDSISREKSPFLQTLLP